MRIPRQASGTGFYHVTLRGNGRQLLFESDKDRDYFLYLLANSKTKFDYSLMAWCLMDNHVHLLLRSELDTLSALMHYLSTAFASYFNHRSGHVGHVFQNRFHSSPIETEQHLLEAIRYIHNNPEDIEPGLAERYRWSSFPQYSDNTEGLADASVVSELIGTGADFRAFCKQRTSKVPSYYCRRLSEEEALIVADELFGRDEVKRLKGLPRPERNASIARLKQGGLSIRQIERVTGIGRGTIASVLKRVS